MTLLASIEPTASVLGTPPADLLLKIVGTARDGQVVRLTSRKCSIGSGTNCTLRLRARGVRPVHCLLLRGPGGTVLRSWAPGTRVNGEIVSDAVLEPGDLITIGPVEFEVLPSEGPPVDPFDAGRTVVLDRRPANRQSTSELGRRSIAPLGPQPADGTTPIGRGEKAPRPRHWHPRMRRLVGEVRKLREQIDRFQQAAPLAEQHAAEANQLHERLESVKQQNQTWEAALERLQAELDGRQVQLADELASLELRRTEIDAERRAWQAEQETQQQALAQRESAHATAESTRHQACAELDRRTQQLDARSAQLDIRESELAAAEAEVRRGEEELAGLRAALESQRLATSDELAAAHQELFATQTEFAAARERIEAENRLLEVSREDLESHGCRLADFEAELVAARQALVALHECEQERLGERTAELERLATELSARELDLAQRVQQASEANTDTVVAEPAAEHLVELESLRQELAARSEELAEARAAVQRADENAREHAATREAAEQQIAQALTARQDEHDAEQVAQSEQLARRAAELADREAAHAAAVAEHATAVAEHQQLVAEHEQARAEIQQARHELSLRADELAQREAALTEQPPAGEAAPLPDANELAALAAQRDAVLAAELELERELEALRAERETLRQERETFAHERLRAADRLDAEARELAEAREQLDAEREELESRAQGQPNRWTTPAYEAQARDEEDSAFSEFSPDRRGVRPMIPSDSDTARAPAGDTLRSRPPAEEDDSIESHIAAFMDRLRTGQPVTPPVIERTLPKRRKSDEQPTPPVAENAEPAPAAPSLPVLDMTAAPMEVARRKAPEEKSSMNILREIGLSHARSAIDTHGQRRSLNQAYTTLAISGACLAAAFFVLFLAQSAVMRSAGVVILVIGIYWMGSSIWAANKVVATIRRRRKGGLRAMLEEVDAEIAAIRQEAEAELAAAEEERAAEPAATE